MTTIAFKDGIMAADSQTSCGDIIVSTTALKLYEIDNTLYGFSGRTSDIKRALKFIIDQDSGVVDLKLQDTLQYLKYIKDCNKLYWGFLYNDGFADEDHIENNMFAIGSGGNFALAALEAGLSAKEAVAIACKFDVYSSGKINTKK